MKKLLILFYRYFSILSGLVFLFKFSITKLFLKKRKIVFVDIDNSIADTWPLLRNGHADVSLLPPLDNSIAFLKENYNFFQYDIVFLSHRDVRLFNDTHRWLLKNYDVSISSSMLYLVPYAEWKVFYYRLANYFGLEIVVFDDLSRNHENGEIHFYHRIISEIKCLNIKYYNFDFIQSLKNKKNE